MRATPHRIVVALLAVSFVAAPAQARDLVPPNDDFARATVVDELPYRAVRDLALATREPGEPLCAIGGGSIWYRLSVLGGAKVAVSVGYAQAALAVYEGTSLESLTMLAGCRQTEIIDARPGRSIYVQVVFDPDEYRVPDDHVVVSFIELGGIAGVVTDDLGAPVAGACVRADNADDYALDPVETTTGPDGSYLLDELVPGPHSVIFGCFGGPYEVAWWQDGNLISVRPGRVTPGIDATLVRLSQLMGTVRNTAGVPVSACVEAYDSATEEFVDADYTDPAGAYSIPLPAGSYKLRFSCAYELESEWYDDKGGFAQADAVAVGAREDRNGLDAVLDGWVSPPGDTPETAIPIESFPFSMIAPFGSARFDAADGSMCNEPVTPGLWFRYEARSNAPVVIELDDAYPAYTVFEQRPEGRVLRACTQAGDSRTSIAFAPKAGGTYLIQVAGQSESDERVTADIATGIVTQSWDALIPCTETCDFDPAIVCEPDPGAAPGSFDDVMITIPASVDGATPTHLVAVADPAVDRDLVMCVAGGPGGHRATAADVIGRQEGAAVRVSPGEIYRVRVFNWADAIPAPGSISFLVQR